MAGTARLEPPDIAVQTTIEPWDEALYESFLDGRWIEVPTMSILAGLVATDSAG